MSPPPSADVAAFPGAVNDWIESPVLQDIYLHWLNLSDGNSLPLRADFDPVDIPNLLPYIYLVDVIKGGEDFAYRLVGTHITESVGFDFTGQRISEFMRTNESEDRAKDYIDCLASRKPACKNGNLVDYGRDYMLYERLLCPMTHNGTDIDIILGGLFFRIVREDELEGLRLA